MLQQFNIPITPLFSIERGTFLKSWRFVAIVIGNSGAAPAAIACSRWTLSSGVTL
jgi:hypothetical protein